MPRTLQTWSAEPLASICLQVAREPKKWPWAYLFMASLTCELLRDGLMVPLPSQLSHLRVPDPRHLRQVVCPRSSREAACILMISLKVVHLMACKQHSSPCHTPKSRWLMVLLKSCSARNVSTRLCCTTRAQRAGRA